MSGVVPAGCSGGQDAVAQGQQFEFVSPGGQTAIFLKALLDTDLLPVVQRIAAEPAADRPAGERAG